MDSRLDHGGDVEVSSSITPLSNSQPLSCAPPCPPEIGHWGASPSPLKTLLSSLHQKGETKASFPASKEGTYQHPSDIELLPLQCRRDNPQEPGALSGDVSNEHCGMGSLSPRCPLMSARREGK